MLGPPESLGLIGSAVLKFIGYKQTDKQSIQIDAFALMFVFSYIWCCYFTSSLRIHLFESKSRLPISQFNWSTV